MSDALKKKNGKKSPPDRIRPNSDMLDVFTSIRDYESCCQLGGHAGSCLISDLVDFYEGNLEDLFRKLGVYRAFEHRLEQCEGSDDVGLKEAYHELVRALSELTELTERSLATARRMKTADQHVVAISCKIRREAAGHSMQDDQ